MSSAPMEEMRRVAVRLRENFNVDAGLEETIERHGTGSIADLAAAQAAVEERLGALQSASDELNQVLASLADLAAVARFTPQGWAERQAELTALFARDAMAGLADWLEDCCQAAAEVRTEPLGRLVAGPFPYPVGTQLLVERVMTLQRALAKQMWALALPPLRAMAAGLRLGDAELPTPEVKAALLLLIARLDVAIGQEPSADLDAAQTAGALPADVALVRAWAARKAGQPDKAASHLADARSGGSAVAFMAEVIRQARGSSVENSLSAARERVAGLAGLADITSQLDRLVEPAPPALWLAIAERAAAEHDTELAGAAFDQAESGTSSDFELGAIVRERRATSLAAAGADPARLADAWVAAGDFRWSSGQPDTAQAYFERALELKPDHVQAALSRTGAESAQWLARPIGEAAGPLARCLAELEALQARYGVDEDTSWSLLSGAELHLQLARAKGEPSAGHLWQALLAYGRVLAIQTRFAYGWSQFAEGLGTFGLYQAALFAARHAQSLEDGPQESYALIRAATGLGDMAAAALELRSDQVDHAMPWVRSMEATVRLWQPGREATADAIAELRQAVQEDSSLTWSRIRLMQAYLLVGQTDSARREARQLTASIAGRRDFDDLTGLARSALMCGEFADAERYAGQLADWEAISVSEGIGTGLTGMARLLQGRAEGADDLVAGVGLARSPQTLNEWEQIDLPTLDILAREHGLTLPSLTAVTDAIARHRTRLAAWADPVAELAEAPPGPADPALIGHARAVLTVLLTEARGDPAAARSALAANAAAAAALPEWPRLADRVLQAYVGDRLAAADPDPALAAESERLRLAPGRSAGRLPDIVRLMSAAGRGDEAQQVIEAARATIGPTPELSRAEGDIAWQRGRRPEAVQAWQTAMEGGGQGLEVRLGAAAAATDQPKATSLLTAALSRSYADTATDLRDMLTEPTDISAVVEVLNALAQTGPDLAPGALVGVMLLSSLPQRSEPPANGIEVLLPPSWYAGMKDPVAEDPLLARYIPEARLRVAWTLPGVQARDDVSLEPDGYGIVILGSVAETGKVKPDVDYAPADAVPLLSGEVRAGATDERLVDLVALRRGAQPPAGLDGWLIMPPAEVVAHRIATVAVLYSQALQQYWSWKSRT